MPSNGRRPGPAARRGNATRRDARRAREELAAEALSHRDQRRLRSIVRTWELASRRRHQNFRHLAIVMLSWIAAMAAPRALRSDPSWLAEQRLDGRRDPVLAVVTDNPVCRFQN